MTTSPNPEPPFHEDDGDIRIWFQTLEPRLDITPSPQLRSRLMDQMVVPPKAGWKNFVPEWRPILTPALAVGFAFSLAVNVWWWTQDQHPLPNLPVSGGQVRGIDDETLNQPHRHLAPDITQGDRYAEMKAYNEAIGAYSVYLETESRTTAVVLGKLAAVYYHMGHHGEARDAAGAALVIQPSLSQASWYRGLSHDALGNQELAIEDWKHAARHGHGEAQETLRQRGMSW